MDNQKKPRAREKKVVENGKGVEIHGEGLGTGPVNNMGNYEDRKPVQQSGQSSGRPSGTASGSPFSQGSVRPSRPQSGQSSGFSRVPPPIRMQSTHLAGAQYVWVRSPGG